MSKLNSNSQKSNNRFTYIIGYTALLACLSLPLQASVYDTLRVDMEAACPAPWEDLGVSVNSALPNGNDLWLNNNADRGAFVTQYMSAKNVNQATAQVAADSLLVVATECASYRIALLDALLAQTPVDVSQATQQAGDAGVLDGANGNRWLAGDVRITGRSNAAPGWVFLIGQTVGSATSGASLEGAEYQKLFDLAKSWAPNSGTENWSSGDTVQLPDMRGRGLFGADNMGGQAANVTAQADQLGQSLGQAEQTLSEAQLPTHSHAMEQGGVHTHSMSNAGSHTHAMKDIRRYLDLSPGSGYKAPWLRSGADMPTRAAGNHKHAISPSASHAHTINESGGSAPVSMLPPVIVFNVEMKY